MCMQPEKNSAATLQNRMNESGEPKPEAPIQSGAPKPGLQSGQADSAEESGLFSEGLLRTELQTLHPQAQGLAKEAVSLLTAACRIPAEWDRLDEKPAAAPRTDPNGLSCRYILYRARGTARMLYTYGILGQKRLSGRWTTAFIAAPFSNNRSGVERLVMLCTEQQLDPVHILDVIHDFMDTDTRGL